MTVPTRLTKGFTQDASWQPLGQIGIPDPFFYAAYYDDYIGYLPGRYTNTVNANGTIAQAAGAYGRLLFTTNSSTPLATDIASQQVDAAAFSIPSGKKVAYLVRAQLADVTNPQVSFGLIQTTTTPFTVTDGIYINKPSGSTVLTAYCVVSSAVTGSVVVPYTPVNATDFDLGILVDAKGKVSIWAGVGLIGAKSQNTAALGPMISFTPTSLPTAVLNPTMALESGTTTSKTMNVDLQFAAVER